MKSHFWFHAVLANVSSFASSRSHFPNFLHFFFARAIFFHATVCEIPDFQGFLGSDNPLSLFLHLLLPVLDPTTPFLCLSVAHLLLLSRCARIPTQLLPEISFLMGKVYPNLLIRGPNAGLVDESSFEEGRALDDLLRWRSSLSVGDGEHIWRAYTIRDHVVIRILGRNEGVQPSDKFHEVVMYEAMLKVGLWFPFPALVQNTR